MDKNKRTAIMSHESEDMKSVIIDHKYLQNKSRKLSDSENKVAMLIIEGFSTKEIADILKLPEKTIKFYTTTIYKLTNHKTRSRFIVNYYKTNSFYNEDL